MPSAGDVERFAYCPHNWWLARSGVEGDGGDGEAAHAAMGAAQDHVEQEKRDYRDGVRWSFRVLLVASSVSFLALELVYLRADPLHWVFLTAALVLLSSSTGLLVIALDAQRRYRKEQQEAGLVPGHLIDSDLGGTARLLEDPEWGLTGRPDYILDTAHGKVPVEVKSRKAPPHPYASHRMQLAVYLRLLEAQGETPAYGLLNYSDGVFRVDWDDALHGSLRDVLERMRVAEAAGVADRDHHHKGRCHGCARRAACDQAL